MQPLPACQHYLPAALARISVRGLSEQQLDAFKGEDERQRISTNRLVLRLLIQEEDREGSGEGELDALAGFSCGEREVKNRLELRQCLDHRRVETPSRWMACG